MDIAVFIMMIIFSVPILGILSNTYLKAQKLKLQGGFNQDDLNKLKALAQENNDLKRRIENLEGIVTSMDKEILGLYALNPDPNENQKKVEELAKTIKKLKG